MRDHETGGAGRNPAIGGNLAWVDEEAEAAGESEAGSRIDRSWSHRVCSSCSRGRREGGQSLSEDSRRRSPVPDQDVVSF